MFRKDTMDPVVTSTPEGFTLSHGPHGEKLSYRFDDILKITVRTTAGGPFTDDIFYEILTTAGAVVLPSEAQGVRSLVDEHFLKLPGFDYEAFIKAMGSTDDQAFVCFEKV
jgi:hypothetical protein